MERLPLPPPRSGLADRPYRVVWLVRPEREAPAPRGSRSVWLSVAAALLLGGLPAALPGSGVGGLSVPALNAGRPRPAARPAPLVEGEWLTLVGADAPASTPRPAGWGVTARPRSGPEGFLRVASAVAHGLGSPEPVTEALREVERAGAWVEFAEAGGEVHLTSGYAPPWLWASMAAPEFDAPARPLAVAVVLPPAYDGLAHHFGSDAVVEGVDYTDPLGVGLPLRRARGFEDSPVSAHFRVGDFATHDGAPYVRIAADLVSGLERMRALLGPITVISGYRHPRYNALPSVRGDRLSRHQAGQAADVWSATESSFEVVRAAIQALGCGVGLGLGRNTVHVDVRGFLSTWTYPGAPLGERAFDQWVRQLCGAAAAAPPPTQILDPTWLTLVGGASQPDDDEAVHLSDEAVEEAVAGAFDGAAVVSDAPAPPAAAPSLDVVVRRDLAGFARSAYARSGPGVVVVDLRDGAAVSGPALSDRAHYARLGTPEVLLLNVRELTAWAGAQPDGAFFVYAVRLPGGRVDSGVAPAGPEPAATAPATRSAPALAPAPAESLPVRSWIVASASRPTLAEAEAYLQQYEAALAGTGLRPVLRVTREGGATRYGVAVGPFGTDEAARAVRDRTARALPVAGEVVRVDE